MTIRYKTRDDDLMMRPSYFLMVALAIMSFFYRPATGQDNSAIEQDFAAAKRYQIELRHEDAARVFQRILKQPDLSAAVRVRAHIGLAQTLEAIPGSGEQTRATYKEIKTAYAELPESSQAAYRLGCLYHSILLPGTVRSPEKAKAEFEYVVQHASTDPLLQLRAHMNLGNLAAERKNYDSADTHFRIIHETAQALIAAQDPKGGSSAEQEAANKQIADELKYIRDRAAMHMVENCVRPTLKESLAALNAIRDRYPGDPQIEALAATRGRKLVASLECEVDRAAKKYLDGSGLLVASQPVPEPSVNARAADSVAAAATSPSSLSSLHRSASLTGPPSRRRAWTSVLVALAGVVALAIPATYALKKHWGV